MSGLSMGLFIEGAVAVLMALTLGYCVILNRRLAALHADPYKRGEADQLAGAPGLGPAAGLTKSRVA